PAPIIPPRRNRPTTSAIIVTLGVNTLWVVALNRGGQPHPPRQGSDRGFDRKPSAGRAPGYGGRREQESADLGQREAEQVAARPAGRITKQRIRHAQAGTPPPVAWRRLDQDRRPGADQPPG